MRSTFTWTAESARISAATDSRGARTSSKPRHNHLVRCKHAARCVLTCYVGPRHDWTIFVRGPRQPYSDGERRNVTLHHQVAPRNHVVRACRYTRLSWRQQDIATRHTASATIQLIQKHFGMYVSSRNTEHRWPANFPDISPPNFLLWGHLKGLSHKRSLQNHNAVEEVSVSCCTSRIRRHVQKNNQDPPTASRYEFR